MNDWPKIDRARAAERIRSDVETLAGSDYTLSSEAIRRYAYTDVYRATLDYFTRAWAQLGFTVTEDPIGNLVARNRPPGEPVFGIGSHCDSNRNGGKWDGTLGVVSALEVCRCSAELGLDLPLQAISFLEEEGSGFGQMVLGSRIVAGRVEERELRETFVAVDDGRPFWAHAEDAGYTPANWRECAHILDDLTGWIELHIEQGRVLQDTDKKFGVVKTIAGYVHGDIYVEGRADHAGATPDGHALRQRAGGGKDDRRARAAGPGGRCRDRGYGRRDRGGAGADQRDPRAHPNLGRRPGAG